MSKWIKWSGGSCPVPGNTRVAIQTRNGDEIENVAEVFEWRHSISELAGLNEIIKYRVVDSTAGEKMAPKFVTTYEPTKPQADMVNHPPHYTSHPSGIECIEVTQHMGFNLGNALKYIWRCDLKKDAIEDLEKALWYIRQEIMKREKARVKNG